MENNTKIKVYDNKLHKTILMMIMKMLLLNIKIINLIMILNMM